MKAEAPPVAAPLPRLRVEFEDFLVDEVPSYPASGVGDHTFVRIEKRDATTEFAAKLLARGLGVPISQIGIAGRKDRRAVTTQWMSLPQVDPERALAFEHPNVRVLEALRHEQKLRTGHLRGNRFSIRLREVSPALLQRAHGQVELIRARGFENRFGAQRFGRDGDNAQRARAWMRGERGARPRSKSEARFLLSALQSEVFNRVLDERPLALDVVEVGDVAFVHDRGGRFVVEDVEAEAPRAARFEISATGPIFGTKMMQPQGEPARREAAAFEGLGLPPGGFDEQGPPLRARGTRRPLRERVQDLEVCDEGGGSVRLQCQLPAGSYVTVLIHTLFGAVREGEAALPSAPAASSDDTDRNGAVSSNDAR